MGTMTEIIIIPSTQPGCVDSVTTWRLCQEDMTQTVPYLLGFCYFVSVCLRVFGAHNFPCNGPHHPYIGTYFIIVEVSVQLA